MVVKFGHLIILTITKWLLPGTMLSGKSFNAVGMKVSFIYSTTAKSCLVFEYTYFTYFQITKTWPFTFLKMTYQKVVKVFSKSLVLNPSKWVHILRSVITVIQFSASRVWSILSHYWIMTLTLLHKRVKFSENMSIEILASNSLVIMGIYRGLSHTVLSFIVSCVRISEQDVRCWWITGIEFW